MTTFEDIMNNIKRIIITVNQNTRIYKEDKQYGNQM